MKRTLLAGAMIAAFAWPQSAPAVVLQPVGTFASPVYMTSPRGDSRLFVVEQGGTIRVVRNGVSIGTPFLDISGLTTAGGERGLLSMAFDPNYASNGLFYVDYTGDGTNSGGATGDIHIDEFQVSSNPDVANPASRRQVLTIPHSSETNHNGGQLQFGKDGNLYISVGDGGGGGDPSGNGQNTSVLLGKLLRINPRRSGASPYTIPASNPFVGVTGADEIWSFGLRNPWRFSFDHLDGSLLIADVGQGLHEEIDFQPASTGFGRGANFGWNCREGFSAYSSCGGNFTDPVFDYPHSDPGGGAAWGCAIVGGYVYRGTEMPGLVGRYLYADLCTSVLRSIQPGLPRAGGDRGEIALPGMPTSFGEDGSCRLYVAAGNEVLRIAPSGSSAAAAQCSTRLTLKASKRKVRSGRRVKLVATAAPCPDLSGATVRVRRGRHFRKKIKLDSSCRAKLRVRISHRAKFRALFPGTAQLEAASADPVRVKIKH